MQTLIASHKCFFPVVQTSLISTEQSACTLRNPQFVSAFRSNTAIHTFLIALHCIIKTNRTFNYLHLNQAFHFGYVRSRSGAENPTFFPRLQLHRRKVQHKITNRNINVYL